MWLAGYNDGVEMSEALIAESIGCIMKSSLWDNNLIQFARVIEEAQAAGAFTKEIQDDMCLSMDLEPEELHDLMERARKIWEESVRTNCPVNRNRRG